MAVLVIAEHDNAHVKDATHKALTAALQMGGDVHVLVASGYIDPEFKNKMRQAGVSEFISKPYMVETILAALAKVPKKSGSLETPIHVQDLLVST